MHQGKRVGGSLERAMSDNHSFNPFQVIQEGIRLTRQSFAPLLGAVLVCLAIFTLALMIVIQVFIGTVNMEDPQMILAMLVLQILIMPPLFAAIHCMGIMQSVGATSRVQDVFKFIKQPFPFVLVALITQIISQLAAGLLPGVIGLAMLGFISVTLSMAIPLVAEYKLSPLQAIRCSFLAVIKRFLPFLGVYAVMFGLFIVGILTFGIGLIFVIPLFYNVKGIMYRDIFGVGIQDNDTTLSALTTTQEHNSKHDTWDA